MSRVSELQLSHGNIYLYGDAAAGMQRMMNSDEAATLAFMEKWSEFIFEASGKPHVTTIIPKEHQT